jgi:hypothetical protein
MGYSATHGSVRRAQKVAPAALGTSSFPALVAAPGTYVFDR